jgi:hypothetical protein
MKNEIMEEVISVSNARQAFRQRQENGILNLTKSKNIFLESDNIESQIPSALNVNFLNQKNIKTNGTIIYISYNNEELLNDDAFYTSMKESLNANNKFTLLLNVISNGNKLLDYQKNSDLIIKTLLTTINITELKDGQREAKHHLFSFLFDAINNEDFKSIVSLIEDKSILSLKYVYLVSIVNLTYKYKENIEGYATFFSKVKDIAKVEMSEKNFELTFRYFK